MANPSSNHGIAVSGARSARAMPTWRRPHIHRSATRKTIISIMDDPIVYALAAVFFAAKEHLGPPSDPECRARDGEEKETEKDDRATNSDAGSDESRGAVEEECG
jgi:tryptophan 2,3-dioxygenase